MGALLMPKGKIMNDLNSILLEGNLTADPEKTVTKNGYTICNFNIAVNHYKKKGEETIPETCFFSIETWNKLAETCSQTLEKGSPVRVVGRLGQSRWQDEDGKPREKIFIIAEHVEKKGCKS